MLLTAWQVWHTGIYDLTGSLVHAFFLASSMITDNGLATSDYASWPAHTIVMLLLASFFWRVRGVNLWGGLKRCAF
ncbi:potassium transporter TrkG [Cronobacter sakazakii]|nr:potassium transporter TrkG [Cronobacter sakazakii]